MRDPRTALTFAALAVSTLPVRSGWLRSAPRGLYAADVTPEVLRAASRHRADESLTVLAQLVVGSRRPVRPTGAPTLVIGGRDDGLVPSTTVRRLAARLGADHEELPVAHNFSEEPSGVVVDHAVRRWLDSRPTLQH
ncbi:alpha/beta fold hydrolase [Nocardioides marmoraquaticus]